jgi:hypothetical protein
VLRILRGQNPANMSVIQERMIAKTSTTRLVDKLLLKNCDHVFRKQKTNRGFDYAKGCFRRIRT